MMVRAFLLILSSLVFWGCAQEKSSSTESAKVKMALPHSLGTSQIGTADLNNARLIYAAVEISSGDESLFNWVYEACRDNCSAEGILQNKSVPTAELEAGNGRMIQLIAVYVDFTTGDFYTFYGGSPVDLVAGDQSVSIDLEATTTSTSSINVVTGRYYDSSGSSPTGEMDVYYQRAPGLKWFRIHSSSIFNGHFKVPLLTIGSMKFKINDEDLVGLDEINVADLEFRADTDESLMKATVPPFHFVKKETETGGTPTVVDQQSVPGEKTLYLGNFGPGSAEKKACYVDSLVGQPVFYETHSESGKTIESGFYEDQTGISSLLFSTNVADVSSIVATGTPDTSAPSCTATADPIPSADAFVFNPSNIGEGGVVGAVGFSGPLMLQDAAGTNSKGFVHFDHDSAAQTLELKWTYIPGIQSGPSGIRGVGIFQHRNTTADLSDRIGGGGEAQSCRWIAEREANGEADRFEFIGKTTDASFTITGISTDDFINSDFILCPFWDGFANDVRDAIDSGSSHVYLSGPLDMTLRNHKDRLLTECSGGCSGFAGAGSVMVSRATTPEEDFLGGSVELFAMLTSSGVILDRTETGVFGNDQSHPTLASIFPTAAANFEDNQGLVDSAGQVSGDGGGFQAAAYYQSVSLDVSTREHFAMLASGTIVKVDPTTGGPIDLTGNCPFDTCQLPAWAQSFSVDRNRRVLFMDHGGQVYSGYPGSLSFETQLPAYVTSFSMY